MSLRDLSHWDFFKLILIIELLIGILIGSALLLIAFAFSANDVSSAVTVEWRTGGELFYTIPLAILLIMIFAMIKASFLSWTCQFTPLGNIQIGNTKFGKKVA